MKIDILYYLLTVVTSITFCTYVLFYCKDNYLYFVCYNHVLLVLMVYFVWWLYYGARFLFQFCVKHVSIEISCSIWNFMNTNFTFLACQFFRCWIFNKNHWLTQIKTTCIQEHILHKHPPKQHCKNPLPG